MLAKRQAVTHAELADMGDRPTQHMNFLQRIFAWLFGGAAAAQAFQSDSVMDSVNGVRNVIEPMNGVLQWAATNKWYLIGAACVGLIALLRLMRNDHVEAYRNFDYQGPPDTARKGA